MILKIEIRAVDEKTNGEYKPEYGVIQSRLSAEISANTEEQLQECFTMLSERVVAILGMPAA